MKILTIHGNGQTPEIFTYIEGENIIHITLPGHNSTEDLENYSVDTYASFVEKFIDGPVIIIGHSLGGHIALEVAGRNKQVRGFISIGAPPLSADTIADAFKPNCGMDVLYQENPPSDQLKHFCSNQVKSNKHAALLESMFNKQSATARLGLLASLGNGISDEIQLINSLETPYLYLYGNDENIVNLDYVRKLNLKGYRELEGGHTIMLDNPLDFNLSINDFIASIPEL